jgi:hypothetical protein
MPGLSDLDYGIGVYRRITRMPDFPEIAFTRARTRRRKMIETKVTERVSDLLKITAENRQREKLGTIQDLMVGVDGRLKYAILCHEGFLGIGDVLIPIPFDALMTSGETGTAVLDMDKQTLEMALSFESKTWPDFTAAEWEEKIDRYFAAHAAVVIEQQST